ncbi:DNA packaging protein [bacterium]|nr:DNA packaging protein [bacterium]
MNQPAVFKRTVKQKEATKILSNFTYSLLVGGSRSGKTFLIMRSIVIRALKERSRHLIIRLRFNHVKTSIWYDTFPKVMQICFPDVQYTENKSDWKITFNNGSEIWMAGIDGKQRTEKILGHEYATIYVNEASQVSYEAIYMLMTRLAQRTGLKNRFFIDCNPPTKKHWTYKLFYEFVDPITEEPKNRDLYGTIVMNPTDNQENLSKDYISEMLESLPKRQKDRFLYGIYVNDVDGAIWNIELLNKCVSEYCTFEELKKKVDIRQVVIGVDPSTKAKEDSDLCGIVIVAQGNNNKFYVINDLSLKATPGDWADKVIWAYKKYMANLIVVETNQGGEMVKTILTLKKFFGKIVEVHASQSKHARAEPVEAMYEQGRVEHLNTDELRYLEDEMTTYVPTESKKSPDRLDALVWALSHFLSTTDTISQYDNINFNNLSRKIIRG